MSIIEGHSTVEFRERLYFFGGRDAITGMLLNAVWTLPIADIARARLQKPEDSALITAKADRRYAMNATALAAMQATGISDPATADAAGILPPRQSRTDATIAVARADEEAEHQAFVSSFTNSAMPVVAPRPVHCTGHVPTPRCYHQSCVRESFMLVTGGTTARDVSKQSTSGTNDDAYLRDDLVLWALNLDSLVWSKYYLPGAVSTVPRFNGAPLPRCHGTLTSTPESALLYGGFPVDPTAPPVPNHWSLFEINENAEARALPCAGDAPTLWGHTAAFAHGCLFVYGGVDSATMSEVNTLCVYSFTEHRWRWADFALAPEPRALHSCVVAGSKMYVFGGFSGRPDRQHFPHLGDTWSFCLNSGLWEEVQCGGDVPPARSGHSAVAHGGVMYVAGGLEGNAANSRGIATLCALDLKTAIWTTFRLLFDDDTPAAVRPDVDVSLLDAVSRQDRPPVLPSSKPSASERLFLDRAVADNDATTRLQQKEARDRREEAERALRKGGLAIPNAAAVQRNGLSLSPSASPVRGVGATPNLGSPPRGAVGGSIDVASLMNNVRKAEERAAADAADVRLDTRQWQQRNDAVREIRSPVALQRASLPVTSFSAMDDDERYPSASGRGAGSAGRGITPEMPPDTFLAMLERQKRAAPGVDMTSPPSSQRPNYLTAAMASPGRAPAPSDAELRAMGDPNRDSDAVRARLGARPPAVDAALAHAGRVGDGSQDRSPRNIRHATFVPAATAPWGPSDGGGGSRTEDAVPSWATSPLPPDRGGHSVTSVRYGERPLAERLQTAFVPIPSNDYTPAQRRSASFASPNDDEQRRRRGGNGLDGGYPGVGAGGGSNAAYPRTGVLSPPAAATPDGGDALTPAREAYLRRARLNPA